MEGDNKVRQDIASRYLKEIVNPRIVLPTLIADPQHVWHLFTVRTEDRYGFQQYLQEQEIQTVIHYPIPPHKQKAFERFWPGISLPISERIHDTIISLPISPVMTNIEVTKVIEVVNNY